MPTTTEGLDIEVRYFELAADVGTLYLSSSTSPAPDFSSTDQHSIDPWFSLGIGAQLLIVQRACLLVRSTEPANKIPQFYAIHSIRPISGENLYLEKY